MTDTNFRLPRYRTKDRDLDRLVVEVLELAGATENQDQLFEMIATVTRLAGEDTDRLDLKISNAALKELRYAFKVFAPYRHIPKITMFGSARTLPEDPMYVQARELARVIAEAGWMVVTGAGPGIMAAGLEGAGRDRSFGVNIRLPFEQGANEFIAGDPKLIELKYFFTRKLMLVKESTGFVVLPGGFGTLDECLELLTLLQTGKAMPAPLVLLDVPGATYWRSWETFVREEVATRGLISTDDDSLFLITDDVGEARREILGFYRNYHSIRYVGDRLVMRLRSAPTAEEVADLAQRFADLCTKGTIEAVPAFPAEVEDDDEVELPRLALAFNRMNHGRLRDLIDAVNALSSAPPEASIPQA